MIRSFSRHRLELRMRAVSVVARVQARLRSRISVGPACRAGLRGLPRPVCTSINEQVPHSAADCTQGSPYGESPARQAGPTKRNRIQHTEAKTNREHGHPVTRSLSTIAACLLMLSLLPVSFAQETPTPPVAETQRPNEQFIPADQLDTVFERDRRGVMMKRDEFKALLEKARANAATSEIPIPIITEQANLFVTPGEHQATVRMELKVRQFAEGWQLLKLRAGNLQVEKAEINGQAALVSRDPAEPSALLIAHDTVGDFTIQISMSTPLAKSGSDQSAAFELPVRPAVQLNVECPAGRHLLVNDLKLERPAGADTVANYVMPVGNAPDVRLRWVVQQKESESQILVFVRTDGTVAVQRETLRWESDSRISVFGGSINKVVAQVPSQLEVTRVESAGLEGWTLEDDPTNAGQTRVTLTYRQPFTNDRVVRIHGVSAATAATSTDAGASSGKLALQRIPTLQFAEVTAHTGRLIVTHENGLRLVSETGGGVRTMSAADLGVSLEASVFDFWLQQFELKVAARPRDRELFAESNATLRIDDTSATFETTLTIEALNAPLFELLINLPADWQLTSVQSSSDASNAAALSPLTWTNGSQPNQILVKPSQPIAPGQLMNLTLALNRTIGDPDQEQKMPLPIATAAEVTTVGGFYKVQFADDLVVAPTTLAGLTPVAGSGTEQVFQNLGTTVSGEFSITRKPARLAARSVLTTWADSRQQSTNAEIITDVLNGTIRTLVIRLSESLGPDVRFEVTNVGPVPGIQQTRAIRPVTIIEQSAGTPAEGLRPFILKLDHRFAGSLSLQAHIQQARQGSAPIAAPVVQLQDAVRQHGVLVFEATPEQQLTVGPEVRAIPGLFVADPGLVDAPAASTGRRIALTYRFVQPGYSFQVAETRFATNAVPSAVCEQLANVCTLNDSGSIQRWCQAQIRSSGVQTLRFTLPDGDRSFLWSTMLNGEPVEVRREADEYLVAIPAGSDRQDYSLTVLFESEAKQVGSFGQLEQGPVQLTIDAGDQQSIPIDVLEQTWKVHYPRTSLLVESDGQFRPTSNVDQPGWLVSLGTLALPEVSELPRRLIPLAMFLLVLFVITVVVSRRRWKTLAAVGMVGVIIVSFTFLLSVLTLSSSSKLSRVASDTSDRYSYSAPPTASAPTSSPAVQSEPMPMAEEFSAAQDVFSAPAAEAGAAVVASDAFVRMTPPEPAAPGGMGGVGAMAGAELAAIPQAEPQSERRLMERSANEPTELDMLAVDIEKRDGVLPEAKKGSARLSVNVNLDIPADYQTREFISVADTVHQPSVLSLVVQRRSQIRAIRWFAAMIVILVAWRMRKSPFLWKLTVSIILLLTALALLPLVSNQWQSVLDGIAIGSVIGAIMAVVCGCCSCCSCPLTWLQRCCRKPYSLKKLAAVILVMTSSTMSFAQDSSSLTPDIVVPYDSDKPALRADQVFIRHKDFLKLYQQANPDSLRGPIISPLGSTVVSTYLKSTALTPVEGTKSVLSFEGRFVVWCDSEQTTGIPLPLGPVAVRSVMVDGKESSVQPLLVGVQGVELPAFASQQAVVPQQPQQVLSINSAGPIAPGTEGPAYSVQTQGKGFHVVDVKFDITAQVEGELGRADLPLRSAATGTLEWTLPADSLDAKVNGRTNGYRREGRKVILPIAQLSTLRLQWLPAIQKVAGDVVVHSTAASTLALQDSGLTLRTSMTVAVRQGEISELDVTIPEGYSVQSVTGDDVAGWAVQNTDASRSVKLQFRRSVNDGTKFTFQLYAPSPEKLDSLPIPISIVRGASRELGTVILKTGGQFQVRSDALSAVTQINPNEAPAPDGEDLPGRPMLAWRYTRHPASVTVKVTPTADELSTEAVHAVRLEEQRQLWSSRLTLVVQGSPRSRIDISVPKSFLALDVSATALKDWYFVDGETADAELRTLSIQLTDARSGTLQIALQGQMNRDADRSLLKLTPPTVLNSTTASSQLAVWLDAASENAGYENGVGDGADWTVKSPASAQGSYREISPTAPLLAFQSNAVRPGALAIKLRQAVSTLIGESVTVTNVTETAAEITLALNWQINRAAADQFAVELPTSLASLMTFQVPGQRKVTRDDLGNGLTRVTLLLQQPVTDRLFALGMASLPLPTDKVIRSSVPNMVIPQGAASTLSGQAHYWVLVNQSNGLLQPSADQPEDKVNADQITTQIPPELLQQAIAVVKLRPETAVWNLVYPEQHQVSPAVVNLASHTTVIADDGSWRSRHVLRVMNESRQFIPVILPENSRLMYCLVQGRPSRVVVRGEGEKTRHLIPIPQSGALAAGFEVEFALAGRFDDAAAGIRNEWKSRRLTIPVPRFPEFREDPDFGISIARNRWSVYVPESWNATPVVDPAATNVLKADVQQLEDLVLLSAVDQTESLLKAAKGTKGGFLQRRLQTELQRQYEDLSRISGNDLGVEQQRGIVLGKLNEANSSLNSYVGTNSVPQIELGRVITGNGFLFEQDAAQNKVNGDTCNQFMVFNCPTSEGRPNVNGAQQLQLNRANQSGAAVSENAFRFGITVEDVEKAVKDQADKSEKKSGESKSGESKQMPPRPNSRGRMMKDDAPAEKPASGDEASEYEGQQSNLRSKLMQRRSGAQDAKSETEASASPSENANVRESIKKEEQAQRSSDPFEIPHVAPNDATQQAFGMYAPAQVATPTGLLSLQFEIPTDGQRIDFLRVDGNPALALDVRSSESVHKGFGFIWLAVCVIGILLLIGPARRGHSLVFWLRLFLILAISGLAAWLFIAGDLKDLGLMLCLAGALGVAVTSAILKLSEPVTVA
jgi:hypothetical protein